jgi:hypothetical protein
MSILNLTQHQATADQLEAGVVEPASKEMVRKLLTVNEIPRAGDLKARAEALAAIAVAEGATTAMIGGAPYLMAPLEAALREAGVKPVYAFSRRESVDVHGAGGTVTKTAVFVHAGWIEV